VPAIGRRDNAARRARWAWRVVSSVSQYFLGENMMLATSMVTTMLPVKDLQRACDFYESKLGLKAIGLKADGKFAYQTGGNSQLALFPKEGGTKADHTAVSFEVPDIADAVRSLKDKGVVFEDYDFPGLKTVDHVALVGTDKAAWFKDTEGNYLCLHQEMG
jgi:catechol 2,3-dioxygenase-like lactoylglutathione lyase family enzyme